MAALSPPGDNTPLSRYSVGEPRVNIIVGTNDLESFYYFLKILFIYLFLDWGEGKEKERERSISVWLPLTRSPLGTWPTTQACALTGNWTSDSLVRRPALNPLSYISQGQKLDSDHRSRSILQPGFISEKVIFFMLLLTSVFFPYLFSFFLIPFVPSETGYWTLGHKTNKWISKPESSLNAWNHVK